MYKALVVLSGVGLSIGSFLDGLHMVHAGDSAGIGFAAPGSGNSVQNLGEGDILPATLRGGNQGAEEARRQISHEPLAALALAMIAQQRGVDQLAGLQLAERVTRRHPALQLEFVNATALTGDVAGAVEHLDKALRVRPQLGKDILPKLVPAIADPAFRGAIGKFADRPWVWQYLAMAGKDEAHRDDAGAFVLESRDAVLSAQPSIQHSAMKTLVLAGRFREAQELIVASGAVSRKAMETFTPIAENSMQGFEPLTWTLANSEVAQVQLSEEGTWQATIEPGRQSELIKRVTSLNAGRYRITGRSNTDDERVALRMTARCVSNRSNIAVAGWKLQHAQLLTIDIPIIVPEGCESQLWTLEVSNLRGNRTTTLSVGAFDIVRL